MTLSSYAWGHDGGTYTGKHMRQLLDDTFDLPGVVRPTDFLVEQQAVANGTVKVASGGVVITAAGSGLYGKYHFPNDASVNVSINPTSSNGRKDLLIARVNSSTGVPSLHVVEGTPAGSPLEPTITEDNYEQLALITLPGSTTDITSGMVTDRRRPAFRGGWGYGTTAMRNRITGMFEGARFQTTDDDRLWIWDSTSAAWLPLGYYDRSWIVLDEVILSGSGAVSFQNIPQLYGDLRIEGKFRGTPASQIDQIRMRFNNDSGANYSFAETWADDGTTPGGPSRGGTSGETHGMAGVCLNASAGANTFSPMQLYIPGYRDAVWKSWNGSSSSVTGNVSQHSDTFGGIWGSVAAITRIDLSPGFAMGNTFAAGTRVTLLGRR